MIAMHTCLASYEVRFNVSVRDSSLPTHQQWGGGDSGSTDFYGQGVFSMFLPLSDVLDLTHTLKGSNPTPTLTLTLKLSC